MTQAPAWGAAGATLPPPGWYPDPGGQGEHRFWDGRAWSDSVATGGMVFHRPLPPLPHAGTLAPRPGGDEPGTAMPARAALVGLAGFGAGLGASIVLSIAGILLGVPDALVVALSAIGLWIGLVGSCRVASRRYGTGSLRTDFGLTFRASDVGFGLLMALAARVAVLIAIIPFLFGPDSLLGDDAGLAGEFRDDAWAFAVVAVIALVGAPFVEELYFRGLIQRSLTSWVGLPGAIALQAVLFGAVHVSPFLGLANVSLVASISAAGVILGITAWWRKRLATAIVAHAFFNLVPVVVALMAG